MDQQQTVTFTIDEDLQVNEGHFEEEETIRIGVLDEERVFVINSTGVKIIRLLDRQVLLMSALEKHSSEHFQKSTYMHSQFSIRTMEFWFGYFNRQFLSVLRINPSSVYL